MHVTHLGLRSPLIGLLLAALGVAGLAGCGEDFLNPSGKTLIEGTVHFDRGVDPDQAPIFGLGIGILYRIENAAPRPAVLPAAATGVTLGDPYPNPLTSPDARSATIIVDAEAASAARVEIWSTGDPFSRAVACLEGDSLAAGRNTFSWNGTEAGIADRLPNGRYLVRVTLDGEGAVLEKALILNRPVVEAIATGAFNTVSDDLGFYRIQDIAVGETFTATDNAGAVLGPRVLANRVILFTSDIDFRHFESEVRIAPGERQRVDIPLLPNVVARPEVLVRVPRTGLGGRS